MVKADHWVLPAGIEEQLPSNAKQIEELRRKILDLFACWGYELIITPIVEYVESLIIEGDENLNAQTLKLVDAADGRMMGVRADMTPQVARIDARYFEADQVRRLCYVGSVVRAKPQDLIGTRTLLQFGAEIYGHSGINSSVEIIRLTADMLKAIGIEDFHIDVGHVGIYLALAEAAGLSQPQKRELFALIQIKAAHEIRDYLRMQGVDKRYEDWFAQLIELYGGAEVLDSAKRLFQGTGAEAAITELGEICRSLETFGIIPKYDIGETGNYFYENGMVFTVLVKGVGQEIIRGGRYDNIGRIFGCARPAVGFSSDLLMLASLLENDKKPQECIYAPQSSEDERLRKTISALRNQGKKVIECLEEGVQMQVSTGEKLLVRHNNEWVVSEK